MKLATLQKLSKEDLVKLCLDYGYDMAKVMSLEVDGLIGLLVDPVTDKPVTDKDSSIVEPIKVIEPKVHPATISDIDKLQCVIVDLKNDIAVKDKIINDSKKNVISLEGEISCLQYDNNELQGKYKIIIDTNAKQFHKISELQGVIDAKDKIINELQNSCASNNNKLQNIIDDLQKENSELQGVIEELKSDGKKDQSDYNELVDILNAKDKIIKELQKKDSKNILAKEGMQIVIDDLTKEIKVLRDNSNPCNGITGDHQTCIDMREDLFKQVEELSKYDIRDIKERRAKFASELAELDSVLN
jgi:chromosome segregation ATPase